MAASTQPGVSCVIHIHYYAAARELSGVSEESAQLDPEAPTRAQVLEWIGSRHARLAPVLHRMAIAINDELRPERDTLQAGDHLSVLPPVAGGSDVSVPVSELRETPLSLDEAMGLVRRPAAGGVCLFVGVVRDHADGKAVARLDYEAHATLACKEMSRILSAMVASNPELRLCALHRVGELVVGDLAVIVAASAPHRAEAFAACREAIDAIKQTVPIWKKEWAPDGAAHWVNLD